MSIRVRVLTGLLAGVLALPAGRAAGGTPPLVLTPSNDAARPVSWDGTAVLAPAGLRQSAIRDASATAGAQQRSFVARLGPAREARATLWIHWDTPEDLSVSVTDGDRIVYASSDAPAGVDEVVSFDVWNNRTYTVEVYAKAGVPSAAGPQYEASAWVRSVEGVNTTRRAKPALSFVKPNVCGDPAYSVDANGTRTYRAPPACYVKLKMPVNLVFVGFDKAEVDEYAPDVTGLFPDADPRAQRVKPIVESESVLGGGSPIAREGSSAVRQVAMSQGSKIGFLPYAFDFGIPNVVVPDRAWTRRMFAAMKAATTSGELAHPWDRAYLESYTARSALTRRDHPVLPGSPVDFIDAMKVEDWVAANPPKGLSFALDGGLGFTYFVLDTYRSADAAEFFNLGHYHNFRVMNALTTDPDTGEQRGFDWGRVWGGRYRFLMLDTGAAPNSFEGSTQANGGAYRTAGGGDSALADPPVWEYAGCAVVDCRDLLPLFYQRIGENAVNALYTRFARGFATRPRAADVYALNANTWLDAGATLAPGAGPGDLYHAPLVAKRVYEMLSYARVIPTTRVKTLSAGDREQEALTQARLQSAARLPSAAGADPHPVMRMIERNPGAYSPAPSGAVTIPIVNAILPGETAWNGAGEDGTVVGDLGPDPWGLLQSVGDVDAAAQDAHGSAVPGRRGFSAAALRNVGRALGLFPATEGIAYSRDLPPDVNAPRPHPAKEGEQYRAYYRTFDWTHATTATPMARGWFYGKFEVLDRDAIGLAHAMDWLDRALDDVIDAYEVLDVRGFTAPPKPVVDQILRAGTDMGYAVGYAQAGQMAKAVTAARRAKAATASLVWIAARQSVRR